MHKIDGSGNVSGLFTEGNPATAQLATAVAECGADRGGERDRRGGPRAQQGGQHAVAPGADHSQSGPAEHSVQAARVVAGEYAHHSRCRLRVSASDALADRRADDARVHRAWIECTY